MFFVRRTLPAALACAACALFTASASADTVVDTGIATGPDSTVCQWGYPDTATFGQLIEPPAVDTVLDSFSFYAIQGTDLPASITYRAFVYEWGASRPEGAALWQSPGPQQIDITTADHTNPQELFVQTEGVQLEADKRYVIFVSVSLDYESNTDGDLACFQFAETEYLPGELVFNNDAGNEAEWFEFFWSGWPNDRDLAFRAAFSAPAVEPQPDPVYAFDGFYAPVDNRDASGNYVLNAVRAGAAIPVRFSLGGDQGLDVFADGYPRSTAIPCDSQAEVDGVEQTVEAGVSGLSYAAGTGTYTYVWKTDRAWDGCRQLIVKFDDGQVQRANFKFG